MHLLQVPSWIAAPIAFATLDLVIYAQHRLLHLVGFLSRPHRVHHTDLALDVRLGVRFNPLGILLSMGVKIAAVMLLGASPVVVGVFEIMLSSFSLLTHVNLRPPQELDTPLRWIFVTPDMHRVPHSALRAEHDANFGFQVSWWDCQFGGHLANRRKRRQLRCWG